MKDVYMQFGSPQIKGESQDQEHAGWIELLSWNMRIHQPKSVSASSAGGHTSERTEHESMVFSKELDMVSPMLYQHASGGTTFDEVTVDFMRADGEGKRVKYLQIKMKKVIIADVEANLDSGVPTETFALKYAAIQWTYTKQKIGGGAEGCVTGAWSLAKNDKIYSI